MPDKNALRARMLSLRSRQSTREREELSKRVVRALASILPPDAHVGTYATFGGEVDLDALHIQRPDLRLAWPVADRTTHTMRFVQSEAPPGASGAWGIREPTEGETVPPAAFDAMLVPGVAFTRDGARLGMGKGFYDRFLAEMSHDAVTIGVGYNWQILDHIPEDPHDQRLKAIATDTEFVATAALPNNWDFRVK